jgi:dienelactone hydrolase
MSCSRTSARCPWLLLAPLGLALAGGMDEPEPAMIVESMSKFESKGKSIAVETFEPKAPGQYPAIVILYGSGGMDIGGPVFRGLARELARRGYVALLPHYFDRTGTKISDPATSAKHFKEWMETIGDAVTFVAGRPAVDRERIGLLGFSLGAYLSLSNATFDPRVKAVVEFFGGLPPALEDRADKLPPTLILHGDADPIVPVKEAHRLESLLKDRKVPYELHIYKGAGHAFLGADGADSARRTLQFFDKYVKAAKDARK